MTAQTILFRDNRKYKRGYGISDILADNPELAKNTLGVLLPILSSLVFVEGGRRLQKFIDRKSNDNIDNISEDELMSLIKKNLDKDKINKLIEDINNKKSGGRFVTRPITSRKYKTNVDKMISAKSKNIINKITGNGLSIL